MEFSTKEKKKLLLLLLFFIVSSLVQMLGVASIFPFITVITNPEIIKTNEELGWIKSFFDITNDYDFILFMAIFVLILFVTSNLVLMFSLWMRTRFIEYTLQSFSEKIFALYMQESYLFHLKKNSAYLLNNITLQTDRAIRGGLLNVIVVISSLLTMLSILLFLIIIQPYIALLTLLVLCSSYGFIYWFVRIKLSWLGVEVSKLLSQRMKCCSEAINGFKELIVLGREKQYLNHFSEVSKKLASHNSYYQTILTVPKHFIEIIAFGGMIGIIIYYLIVGKDLQMMIPYISLYGFAGYRLMPVLQQFFHGMSSIKFCVDAIDIFCKELESLTLRSSHTDSKDLSGIKNKFCTRSVELHNVSYRYPESDRKTIKNISFKIGTTTRFGIVGKSGAGKSTLVDVIIGLLPVTEGYISVDDKKLTTTDLRVWQRHIGYVPQTIFISDESIKNNIAFGIGEDQIDDAMIVRVAKMANLHDFIVNDLKSGYDTIIGERGERLSGGQRQRIGIARALYNDPEILILDEATSSLDSPTEQVIIKEVDKLVGDKTILIVAHRLSTVKNCEQIIVMGDDGTIKDIGTYETLSKTSASFQKLQMHQR